MKKTAPFQIDQILYFAGVFVIPFLISLSTLEPVLGIRFFALACFVLMLIGVIIIQHANGKAVYDTGVIKQWLFGAFAAYLLLNAISLHITLALPDGLVEFAKMTLYFFFLAISTLLMARDKKMLHRISFMIMLISLVLSVIGIAQYFDLGFRWIPGNFIIHGTMTNKNLLSSAQVLMLPFIVFNIFRMEGKWLALNVLTFFLASLVMGIAYTRASWVAFGGAAIIMLVFAFLNRKQLNFPAAFVKRSHILIISLICAGLLSLALDRMVMAKNEPVRSVMTGSTTSASSTHERLAMWEKSLTMFLDHPVTGVGLGSWKLMLPKYGTEGLRSAKGDIHFVRPHNDFLWVLTETGIFGLLAFLAIFGIAIFYIFKSFQATRDAEEKLVSLLLGFGIIAYGIISMVAFPKERIFHSMLFMIMLAASAALYHRTHPGRQPLKRPILLSSLVVSAILTGLAIWIGFSRIQSEIHLTRSFAAKAQKNWQLEIEELNRAETRFFNIDPMATPIPFYRGLTRVRLEELDKAAIDLEKAYKIHPNHIIVLLNYGVSRDRNGDLQSAADAFKRILSISPGYDPARINLAGIYFKQKRYQLSYDTLLACSPENKDPRIPQYIALLKKTLQQQKRPDNFVEQK